MILTMAFSQLAFGASQNGSSPNNTNPLTIDINLNMGTNTNCEVRGAGITPGAFMDPVVQTETETGAYTGFKGAVVDSNLDAQNNGSDNWAVGAEVEVICTGVGSGNLVDVAVNAMVSDPSVIAISALGFGQLATATSHAAAAFTVDMALGPQPLTLGVLATPSSVSDSTASFVFTFAAL